MKVCVYCASSRQTDPSYLQAAQHLGTLLAEQGDEIIYGGAAVGSMGNLADAALQAGGRVTGIIPNFMMELEWGHPNIQELRVVDSMHTRKQLMVEMADAIVALPGGTGTFDELFEAITWKRLGLITHPIIIVNVNGYYAPLVQMLNTAVNERFMDPRHLRMWSVVEEVTDVPNAIKDAPDWDTDARNFAAI